MSTWILVADKSRARIFAADKAASPLHEVRTLTSPEARLHEGDLVSDRAGQDRNPSVIGHGLNSENRPHKHDIAERFAAQVCEALEDARNQGLFRKLYVIAAPAFLGMLRHHQSPTLRQLIAAEIDKSLAGLDPAAIRKALPDIL
ncbi:host attachment protein [uncultured Thiodictyon sp.]|uniref:host attachment protein n=1 Tax=uncultured Thiodictyon sp. TaxID=1846217 RepID=UPI0025DFE0CC|nr:host attachment protein [uncultured Thiodictyon sp.]